MANNLDELNGRRHFDYIVIGCGGVGSGALYWLSRRAGENVLGLEKFRLGHVNGGSQDVSRIIRLAYPSNDYFKLTPDTFTAWAEVERESGYQLVYKPGSLNIAEKGVGGARLEFYARSMTEMGVPYERLDNKQLMARFPQFTVGPEYLALFQKDAGLVDAAAGNSLHVQLAQGRGAKVIDNCPVNRLSRASSGLIEVSTPKGIFTCKKVVVTAGAWINHVISSIGCHVPVYVSEENVTFFGSPHVKEFTRDKFPVFIYHQNGPDIYGLPVHGITGTKIGIDAGGPITTGDTRTWTPDPVRLKKITELCQKILPKFLGPVIETKVCLYTMTPDRHFLIDTAEKAGFSDVIVCCGAGHAYKFASLLGKILSEMAVDGKTQYDISAFRWDREALTNPNFKPLFTHGNEESPTSKL
ncbi:monomeric sarcosine oxidase [Plakobranchus ocellatus]|uniref:Monomeric sarcosine oxidase n=1 Tax=Plakobranchus ocellatus TaxID=259542 RepID=A0AAV4ACK5_9GAST|nr:monomeric sarcosine oxidase [Plakobranchus ocellatus]